MDKPSEFDQVRSAARYIEEAMDTVNNVLSNPLRVFDASKVVEAENIVRADAETCKELSSELADTKYRLDYNLKGTTEFLEQASKFSLNVSAELDELETFLLQFGFKLQDAAAKDDNTSTDSSNTPRMVNGSSAIDIDTSGILEFEESPDDPHISTGTTKLNRELSFEH